MISKKINVLLASLLITCSLNASEDNPTQDEITTLYVATFYRAPDNGGLNYWLNQSGLTLSQIAQSFFEQEETKKKYPNGTTNREFIRSIYQNLFNREPDTLGWNYWENELSLNKISRDRFIEAVINGAKDDDNGFDETTLENKKEVGLYFANNGFSDMDEAKIVMEGISDDVKTVSFIKSKIDLDSVDLNSWNDYDDSNDYDSNHENDENDDESSNNNDDDKNHENDENDYETSSNDDTNNNSNISSTLTLPTSYSQNDGRLLASQCFQCHGTNGVSTNSWDSIAGEDEMDEVFGEDAIMDAQAHGYTTQELNLIGSYLKTLSKHHDD